VARFILRLSRHSNVHDRASGTYDVTGDGVRGSSNVTALGAFGASVTEDVYLEAGMKLEVVGGGEADPRGTAAVVGAGSMVQRVRAALSAAAHRSNDGNGGGPMVALAEAKALRVAAALYAGGGGAGQGGRLSVARLVAAVVGPI